MTHLSLEDDRTLLDAPSSAVLTLVREDGTALTSPVPGEHARVWSLVGMLPAVSLEIPETPAGSP